MGSVGRFEVRKRGDCWENIMWGKWRFSILGDQDTKMTVGLLMMRVLIIMDWV